MREIKDNLKIIAEVGVNHNGSIKLAKKLVDVAKKAGADFVKFQLYKTENLVQRKTKNLKYQIKNTKKNIGQFALLKKLEINENFIIKIKNYCKSKKINFLCSPFDTESLSLLIKLKVLSQMKY